MSIRVIVVSNDKYAWALKPFSYLFNTYWSSLQEVNVIGISSPIDYLPNNFNFSPIHKNYPAKEWSTSLIDYLETIDDDLFVLLLEDYWLCRTVDCQGISSLCDYIHYINLPILKMDLTNDRIHDWGKDYPEIKDMGYWGRHDIVFSPVGTPYRMSLQAAIWNRKKLLEVLPRGKTPWEVEMHVNPSEEYFVLGTREFPLRYANAILKGDIMGYEIEHIEEPHRSIVQSMIPAGWKSEVPYGNV